MPDETLRQESIKYIGWGIANILNGKIHLHKKLKKPEYRKLKKKIIDHEKGHDLSRKYNMWDMLHDSKHTSLDLDLIYFIISTPSSWLQFSPLVYYKRQIIFDRQTTYIYTIMILAALLGWTIL